MHNYSAKIHLTGKEVGRRFIYNAAPFILTLLEPAYEIPG